MDNQSDQHRSPNRFEIIFSFGCDLEDSKSRRFLRKEKVDQKSNTNEKIEVLEQTNRMGLQKLRMGLRLWSLSVLEFRFGTLRPPRGGGGSMGYRLFCRPQPSFLFVIVFVCLGLWDCGVVSFWLCGFVD